MAMIKCPECGKEISNQAEKCINCGFPIKNEVDKRSNDYIVNISGNKYNLTKMWEDTNGRTSFVELIIKNTSVSKEDANKIANDYMKSKSFKETRESNKKKESTLSVIACVLAIFTITSFVGLILGLIDVCMNDKTKKHTGSWFAIIFGCLVIFACMFLS